MRGEAPGGSSHPRVAATASKGDRRPIRVQTLGCKQRKTITKWGAQEVVRAGQRRIWSQRDDIDAVAKCSALYAPADSVLPSQSAPRPQGTRRAEQARPMSGGGGVPLEAGLVSRSMEMELFASLPVAGQDEFVPVSPRPGFVFDSPPASQRHWAPPEDGAAPCLLVGSARERSLGLCAAAAAVAPPVLAAPLTRTATLGCHLAAAGGPVLPELH